MHKIFAKLLLHGKFWFKCAVSATEITTQMREPKNGSTYRSICTFYYVVSFTETKPLKRSCIAPHRIRVHVAYRDTITASRAYDKILFAGNRSAASRYAFFCVCFVARFCVGHVCETARQGHNHISSIISMPRFFIIQMMNGNDIR